MLKLTDREWKTFFIDDHLLVRSGQRLTKADMKPGYIPFIGASDSNNGVTAFVSNENESTDSNVLGVNYNGSVVETFYHPYKATFSDDVKRVSIKNLDANDKYTLLFLKQCILQQKLKYAYGYKFNAERIKRQKILLPISNDGTPDWEFMADYMREQEKLMLEKVLPYFQKRLLNNLLILGALPDVKWKAFRFDQVFETIKRGKRYKKDDHVRGEIPYISATEKTNGIDAFVGETSRTRSFRECLTIANSGGVGKAFFQNYQFVASDHVTALKGKDLSNRAYKFFVPIIDRLSEKYSFNREITDKRLARERLMLPVTDDGKINYEFMEKTVARIEADELRYVTDLLQNKYDELVVSITRGGY